MYIASIIVLAVAVLMIISAITYIKSYFSSYGMSMSSGWKDAFQYILSNSGSWFVFSLFFFAAGRIIARLEQIKPFGSVSNPKAEKPQESEKEAEKHAALSDPEEKEEKTAAEEKAADSSDTDTKK